MSGHDRPEQAVTFKRNGWSRWAGICRYIAEQPGKLKTLKKHPRINKVRIRTEYLKASIRAKVEHPFRIIKCQFGFVKARYRGLKKNDCKLAMLFALANVVRVDQMLRARG